MLAISLMAIFATDIRMVFWIAVIQAVLAVVCVLFGVEDAPAAAAGRLEFLRGGCSDGGCLQ